MVRSGTSCLGFHFNKPDDSRLKFHQEAGCPALAKHGYILRKDVMALATIITKFNEKFLGTPYQPLPTRPEARLSSEEMRSESASARWVHSSLYRIYSHLPPSQLNTVCRKLVMKKPLPSGKSSISFVLVKQLRASLIIQFGQYSVV